MSKKDIRGMFKLIGIGVGVGFVAAMVMFVFENTGLTLERISLFDFISKYVLIIYAVMFVLLMLPTYIFIRKGRTEIKELSKVNETADEDQLDSFERKSKIHLNLGIMFNGIFMVMGIVLFGITNQSDKAVEIYHFIILVAILTICSIVEINTVRFIQKNDPRLKGDPTSTSFQKIYVESMDEAEKMKTYKSGYDAFILSRNITLGFVLLFILTNMFFGVGASLLALSGLYAIINHITYTIYENKNELK